MMKQVVPAEKHGQMLLLVRIKIIHSVYLPAVIKQTTDYMKTNPMEAIFHQKIHNDHPSLKTNPFIFRTDLLNYMKIAENQAVNKNRGVRSEERRAGKKRNIR